MIRKNDQYAEAVRLRKRGFTYDEIAQIVGVAKSTVSNWLRSETWSKETRDMNLRRAARENSKRISLLNKARGNQHRKLYAEAERSAVTEFRHYRRDPFFMAGLVLYITSGDRTHPRTIRLSHASIELHRAFLRFAREFLGVSMKDVHFWLLLYPAHSLRVCERAWLKGTKIPPSQWYKHQVVASRSDAQTLQYGVGNTIIGSTVLKRKLSKWVELALKAL